MGDSSDIFGDEHEQDDGPTAAELEAAGQSSMFGEPVPAAAPAPAIPSAVAPVVKPAAAQPYRVLARKYRPQTFSALIGQDAMVQTLANAIRRERLAHAFLMTGVRGVGKTSTARLIAKALNCVGPDGQGGATIDPCGQCEPCVAIAEGRHIDVIEMDAASHTGVDDVREIIEAVRYAAVSARYKIYIIDEVHMLSRNAFNALLKTLEEPPAHVKFLFATTEVDKLPVTVLSRCQRFDLRRIPAELLASHFDGICRAESVSADAEALALIAAAAEGSVRDGLSILDQAIAHADLTGAGEATHVTAAQVRDMLGLADKTMQRTLFAALLGGDGAALLDAVAQQFSLGVEPIAMVRAAMDLTYRITVGQIGRGVEAVSPDEAAVLAEWGQRLSPGQLHRLWQLLLKAHDEVRSAPEPLAAAQMALLRCLHAADLPDPGMLQKKLEDMASRGAFVAAEAGAPAAPSGEPAIAMDWEQFVMRVGHRHVLIEQVLRDWVRVIELKPGLLRFSFAGNYAMHGVKDLAAAIEDVTGSEWKVEQLPEGGRPTLREEAEARQAADAEALRRSPLVEAAFAAFPQAEFIAEADNVRAVGERNWR